MASAASSVSCERALVTAGAAQPQRRAGVHGFRDGQRGRRVADAGAAAVGAQLEQDVHRPARAFEGFGHQLDAADRVDPADELERGIGGQLGGQPAQAARVEQLVGQQDPRDAERAVDAQVPGVGAGDAPGAVLDLAGEQLRGHRGLAVRGEDDAAGGAPGGHRPQVVLECFVVEYHEGREEPVGEQVEPPVRGFAQREPGQGGRGRAEPPVDALLAEGVERGGVDRARGGCVHRRRPRLRMLQRLLRILSAIGVASGSPQVNGVKDRGDGK